MLRAVTYPLAVAEEPDGLFVVDADDRMIADLGISDFGTAEQRQHAAEIVAACNAHGPLVAVAEAICDVMNTPNNGDYWRKLADLTPKAEAALAQLKP